MKIEIKNNRLHIDAPIKTGTEAPLSKQGRSRIALSTNGWKFISDENGRTYSLSLNLITKLNTEEAK